MKFAQNHWGNRFYEVTFPLLHTKHLHGKRGPHNLHVLEPKKKNFARNHWGNRVLWGNFSIIFNTQIIFLEKGDGTIWMDYNQQKWNLHQTTRAVGFMWSHFHYYTQITLYTGMIYYGLRIISDRKRQSNYLFLTLLPTLQGSNHN